MYIKCCNNIHYNHRMNVKLFIPCHIISDHIYDLNSKRYILINYNKGNVFWFWDGIYLFFFQFLNN